MKDFDFTNLFHDVQKPVAAIVHQCKECNGLITPGISYFRCAGVSVDCLGRKAPWSACICQKCTADWDTLISIEFREGKSDGLIYGQLGRRVQSAVNRGCVGSEEELAFLRQHWPDQSARLRHSDARQAELSFVA